MDKSKFEAKNLWRKLKNLFVVNDYKFDELFDLMESSSKNKRAGELDSGKVQSEKNQRQSRRKRDRKGDGALVRPLTVGALREKRIHETVKNSKLPARKVPVSECLEENLAYLREFFYLPRNRDVIIREFTIPLNGGTRSAIIYIDGAADTKLIDGFVLQPLMMFTNLNDKLQYATIDVVKNFLVPVNQFAEAKNLEDVISGVTNGDTVILVDRANKALIVETKGWPVRGMSDPKTEKVTQGPSDAFNESFRQNLGLLRKRLRTHALVTEYYKIGWRSKTDLALVYLEGVINPALVEEMRKRIKTMKVAYVTDTGLVQQMIGDSPYSVIPTSLATERPDRVAAFLNEGHLAIVMDGSPFVIIAPITIWGLLHSPEDYYLNPLVGTFTRIVRTISFFIALITPAFYIAITNYHPEMIPTDLLLAIAATRELVPFPVIAEVMLMEFSFELIREAGIRIPSLLGATIGIVGALILGQAAVQANIVSPILVIVVAITALSSFTIPNIAFSYTVRLLRFFFIILAALLGFFGIAFGLVILAYHVTGLKSLGVPMISPVAPYQPISVDIVIRRPFFAFDSMPKYTRPRVKHLQQKVVRKWDPNVTLNPGKASKNKGGQGGSDV